ncbi:MAG: hypothetical protein OXK82_08050 [Deltaproteobacteria bacterium]|nr:hypothetical protein [Deltaproteobacteria bacterium]
MSDKGKVKTPVRKPGTVGSSGPGRRGSASIEKRSQDSSTFATEVTQTAAPPKAPNKGKGGEGNNNQ